MKKSIADTKKRGRGRPVTTGIGTQIGVRWHDDDVAAIDKWAKGQDDRPERAEAIRRLVRLGLRSKG